MRTIKFRGKDIESGNWVYGSLFLTTPNPTIITGDGTDRNQFHFVDKDTVGEFTGQYDKTRWDKLSKEAKEHFESVGYGEDKWIGYEIYEGDFLSSKVQPFHTVNPVDTGYGEVIYRSSMFKLGSISLSTFRGRVYVIGNKFDNENLLNERLGR